MTTSQDEKDGAGDDDDDTTFSCQIDKIQILCRFDRKTLKVQITCVDAAADTEEKILFQWTEISLKNFEEIHGLSRVLLLLPDKCATAIAINNEDLPPPDNGDFLLQLVKDLLLFYSAEQFKKNETKGFVESIEELICQIEHLMTFLKERQSPELILETTKLFLHKCDKVYLAVLFYLDFVHPELLAIQRGKSTAVSSQELFTTSKISILKRYKEKNLSHEFATLSENTF